MSFPCGEARKTGGARIVLASRLHPKLENAQPLRNSRARPARSDSPRKTASRFQRFCNRGGAPCASELCWKSVFFVFVPECRIGFFLEA